MMYTQQVWRVREWIRNVYSCTSLYRKIMKVERNYRTKHCQWIPFMYTLHSSYSSSLYMFSLSDYTYSLPENFIAQEAINPHHNARMMVIDRESGELENESTFWDIDTFLSQDRILFFNNSRVIPARIRLRWVPFEEENGKRWILSDGEILFCKKDSDTTFEALVRPGKKFRKWTKFFFSEGILSVREITEDGRIMESAWCDIIHIMEKYGELPLPPYIAYSKDKEKDYQTAFAKKNGSVAAPTASLHFTRELLEKIPNEKQYITLHVGLGTFKGIDTPDIREYHIHAETIEIEKSIFETIARIKNEQKKIVAVGTTVCRTLESLPFLWKKLGREIQGTYSSSVQNFWNGFPYLDWIAWGSSISWKNPISEIRLTENSIFFETQIYFYPGIEFLLIDDLVTNFHLSESSLLVLVSAFIGREKTMSIYQKAIAKRYRFFSFWDGMYIRSRK